MITTKYIFAEEEIDDKTGVFKRVQFFVIDKEDILSNLERSGILEEQNLSVREDAEDPNRAVMYCTFGKQLMMNRRIVITYLGEKTEEEYETMMEMIEGSFVRST